MRSLQGAKLLEELDFVFSIRPRANFAAKGWAYYAHNAFFWAKIVTFAGIGLLSVPPTIVSRQWYAASLPLGRYGEF